MNDTDHNFYLSDNEAFLNGVVHLIREDSFFNKPSFLHFFFVPKDPHIFVSPWNGVQSLVVKLLAQYTGTVRCYTFMKFLPSEVFSVGGVISV